MWFSISYIERNLYGKPVYLRDEYSLSFEPWHQGDFSIMTGAAYTSLDVDIESGQAVGFSGLNPQRTWVKHKLSPPEAETGRLLVHTDKEMIRGMAVGYAENWKTFYDDQTKWICMSENLLFDNCDHVLFANDTIASLKGTELVAIWAKIEIK